MKTITFSSDIATVFRMTVKTLWYDAPETTELFLHFDLAEACASAEVDKYKACDYYPDVTYYTERRRPAMRIFLRDKKTSEKRMSIVVEAEMVDIRTRDEYYENV